MVRFHPDSPCVYRLATMLGVAEEPHSRLVIANVLDMIPLEFVEAHIWTALHNPSQLANGHIGPRTPFGTFVWIIRRGLGYSGHDLNLMGLR